MSAFFLNGPESFAGRAKRVRGPVVTTGSDVVHHVLHVMLGHCRVIASFELNAASE
jgi:hypothetical protein